MHPNAGQWDDRIEYKVELEMGEMFVEKDGFTYYLNDAAEHYGHSHGEHAHANDGQFRAHVIKSKFVGSSWNKEAVVKEPSTFYRNYLLGNDQSKWKSHLKSYSHVELLDFYSGIDMILNAGHGSLKYSMIVQPGIDPDQVVMEYTGHDKLFLDEEGNLHVSNTFGEKTNCLDGRS